MSLSTKILIWLTSFLTVNALIFIIYQQIQIAKKQDIIEQNIVAQQQLIDGIVRSQTNWATRNDVENFIKENGVNLRAIQDDLDKLHAEVSAVNIAVASSKGQNNNHVPTNSGPIINPNPIDPINPDPYGYMKRQQELSLNEDFGSVKIPIGTVGFSAWQKEPWNYEIKSREYKATTVVGVDENQRNYYYNKLTIKVDNKEYTVPITSATAEQVYPEPKFSWFNPSLYLGVDGSINLNSIQGDFIPDINLQVMSYGKFRYQPDISVFQVGIGYGTLNQRPQLILTPISYNIGKDIPLINNTYLGPSVSIGTDRNISVGVGLRVGL